MGSGHQTVSGDVRSARACSEVLELPRDWLVLLQDRRPLLSEGGAWPQAAACGAEAESGFEEHPFPWDTCDPGWPPGVCLLLKCPCALLSRQKCWGTLRVGQPWSVCHFYPGHFGRSLFS